MEAKRRAREQLKRFRNELPEKYKKSASAKIAKLLFHMKPFKTSGTIGIYLNNNSEVDTSAILAKCFKLKKNVAAPKVEGNFLKFYLIENGRTDCEPGAYEILEPKNGCPRVPANQLGLLVIPGIAFDSRGYRLGYGKGCYDRFLKKNPGPTSVGLCYEKNFIRALPTEKNDVPVSFVLTEKKLTPIKK